MRKKPILLALFCFLCSISCLGQVSKKNRIVIIADFSNALDIKQTTLKYKDLTISNPFTDSTRFSTESVGPTKSIEKYIWAIESDKTIKIFHPVLFAFPSLAYPGDSIYITFKNEIPQYSGQGFEKYELQNKIVQAQKNIEDPVPDKIAGGRLLSLNEYLKLNQYYDEQLKVSLPLIDSYKSRLTSFDYTWIKCCAIYYIESNRLAVFSYIPTGKQYFNSSYTIKDIAAVWDTTMYKKSAKWLRNQHDILGLDPHYFYAFGRLEVWRKYCFDISNDTLGSKPMRVKMYYDNFVKNYKGLLLERTLCFLLDEQVLMEMGAYNHVAQTLLKDYYTRSKFTGYKKWVKTLESNAQYLSNTNGNNAAPPFELTDIQGNSFTKKSIKGKFAILNFWYPRCEDCKEKVSVLTQLQAEFKNDTNVVFLHISVDANRDLWLKSKDAGVYVPKGGIQLHMGSLEKTNEILRDFDITKCPALRYIDADGGFIVINPEPDLTMNKGQWLANFIRSKKPYKEDGPYVMNENGNTKSYYINHGIVTETSSINQFTVATDQYDKKIPLSLQNKITIPPSEYPAAEKILILSDIEGNFTAFRNLLQANKVMDENFNWTFANGHLVFAGDMFDRGEQVTECLWLIYSLEEKAIANGGFVHFILGNHEIMNLNGNDKYVKEKYKNNYKLLGKTLMEMYNERSELGRWLRSKNIIEKIGNNLFCHGGISPQVNQMKVSLEEINAIARPYYDKLIEVNKEANEDLKILFNARKSPFWYRQYYDADYWSISNNEIIHHASESQVDSTCIKFNVNHIITGHTIVSDTISVHYGGKVLNTDTRHAQGKSEALLIEKSSMFFRVNDKGNKILLFKENDGKSNRTTINTAKN